MSKKKRKNRPPARRPSPNEAIQKRYADTDEQVQLEMIQRLIAADKRKPSDMLALGSGLLMQNNPVWAKEHPQMKESYAKHPLREQRLKPILEQWLDDLESQYQGWLIQNGMTKTDGTDPERLDCIDARGILPWEQTTDESGSTLMMMGDSDVIAEWTESLDDATGWLISLPPFRTGMLIISDEVGIAFEVENLDVEERSYELTLKQLVFTKRGNGPYLHTITHMRLKFPSTMEEELDAHMASDSANFIELHSDRRIYRKLNWNGEDERIWNDCYVAPRSTNRANDCNELLRLFTGIIVRVNRQIALCKRQKKVGPAVRTVTEDTAIELGFTAEAPDKIVRRIGPITCISKERPEPPSEKRAVRYTQTQWMRRGYVRHLKSGKVVYVAPTTCHRRMLDQNGERPQVILEIKNQGGET